MTRKPSNERSPSGVARFCFGAALCLLGCKRDPEPAPEPAPLPVPVASAPQKLYLPDDYDAHFSSGSSPSTKKSRRCPDEMVLVQDGFCIDRFEVSMLEASTARELSPHYPPTRRYVTTLFERFKKTPARPQGPLASFLPLPAPADFQLSGNFEARAASKRDVLPAGYLSKYMAETACQRADKRLCSRDEWITACRGQQSRPYPYGASYEEGSCNVNRKSHPARLLHGDASKNHLDPRLGLTQDVDGPLLRRTGATRTCQSTWGDDAIFDMVGNIDEWIDEPGGSFLGGFFSRGTTSGCASSIDLHGPDYLDYSLGTRCCVNAAP